ncbi:methylated-DNA--[protein]-cysteine S-methyltransferase [Yinghuangia soli]|uniref:methylated-DNA--[protein]-cysteine S-methyltransferase n=1 Tax=Yinghuangia soli TaxID=2908204 RepID=A0AA41TZT8_9ACTN|nr:methylated-DNA--[protein]-cysteine S-methyltransferase [Yinghuangia soli]MCF2529153.1 methylated-DNA--[protein]-cysteine S-methyltransferase [Yinghuangia soli]
MTSPPPRGSTVFDTAIGRCGIAWGPRGIVAVHLPERDDATLLGRLPEGYPLLEPTADPPDAVRAAIAAIRALLRGEGTDLSGIELDLEHVPSFNRRVYAVARTIPPGQTMTYGEVAREIGMPGAARAVGHALGRNPCAIVVPCHRVLAAGGASGGFSAHGGVATKWRMLTIEGAPEAPQPTLF